MTVILIAAVDQNNGIGHQQKLPWRYKEDLQLFKSLTIGHGLIMGRKTLESIGRILANREHYVLTRQKTIKEYKGCRVHHSLESAILESCARNSHTFIIGGHEVFKNGFMHADLLYLTRINKSFITDVCFPEIPKDFILQTKKELSAELTFETYRKIKPKQ